MCSCKRNGPRRILVFDDDPSIREIIAGILEEEQLEVMTAGSQAEAEALIERERFDLVVSDSLPSSWDPATLTEIRQLGERAHAPVILCTAFGEAALIDPSVYGLAAVLTKPFEMEDLVAVVHRALGDG